MRKFALVASVCAVCLCLSAALAHAQQIDIAVSGSSLFSEATPSDLAGFRPPLEKGGVYAGLNGDYVGFGKKHRLGVNVETAWRYHLALYPFNGETYRPIFTDANALFQPHIHGRFGLDIMAGVGLASNRFTLPQATTCSVSSGCVNYTSSNHLMEHIGGGVRCRFFRNFFVRGEVHYYHVDNNLGFQSNNVLRLGASVGHTWGGSKPAEAPPAATPHSQ